MSAVKRGEVKKRPFVAGITGKTGAGKSVASAFLRRKGYRVIDVDSFAHTLYEKKGPLYNKITRAYPGCVSARTGKIDRQRLGKTVFSSKKEYRKFTPLVFPALNRALDREIKKYYGGMVFLDMAVLFESGFYKKTDCVILLLVSEKKRKAMAKSARSRAKTEKVSRFQDIFGTSKKIALSDYILYNNKNREVLYRKINNLAEKLRKGVYGRKRGKNKGSGRKSKQNT